MNRSSSLQNHINSFRKYISPTLGNEKPLCKLISTGTNYYLYDSATNKLMKCEFLEYEILKHLLEYGVDVEPTRFIEKYGITKFEKAVKGIEAAVKAENVLKLNKFHSFGISHSYEKVIDKITNNLKMIHLEVTNKCNLNCQYCVFNENTNVEQRKHGNLFMNTQFAFAAVDYLVAHSSKCGEVCIGFYGGEPTLNMPLIHKTVEYAKGLIKQKKLRFTITTNATLITEEIAKFFYKEDFAVMVSLDGPKHIHDLWRIDHSHKGSYHRTMSGLKKLLKTFKNKEHKIGFSIVYAPPYSEEKLSEIEGFFYQSHLMPEISTLNITYPVRASISVDHILKYRLYEEDYSLMDWARKRYLSNYPNRLDQNPLAKTIVDRELVRLVKRPLFDKPLNKIHLNGCCIPASRKLFVTVSGTLRLCERVCDAPEVGHVKDGVILDTIKRVYLEEYSKKSIENCSQCWIARLCDICYAQVFTDFIFDPVRKKELCDHKRRSFENKLVFLCSLMEKDRNGLEYLNSHILS